MMITDSELDRLLAVTAQERSVLSLYLWVPSDPAELRELPARVHGLLTLAGGNGSRSAGPRGAGGGRSAVGRVEQRARTMVRQHGREWLGHTAAIFVAGEGGPSAGAGLSRAFSLPCRLPDRAIIATRPHIRPLLVARQRCPAHYVVIVDREHAWLFRVTGDHIEIPAAAHADESGEMRDLREQHGVRSAGFGGWYGLESYRVNERIIELAHEHFRATIERIERAVAPAGAGSRRTGGAAGGPGRAGVAKVAGRAGVTVGADMSTGAGVSDVGESAGFGGPAPLVLGGHEQTIGRFAEMLPADLRARLAGTFVVDTHTMTPGRLRELAGGIIANWVGMHEQRRTLELREAEGQHDPLTVTGLNGCLDAVNQHAVDLLVVPVGGVIDGYVCARCGAVGSEVTGCPDGPAESRWVPDLFEEMVIKTISDGGRTEALTDPPGDVAAHLRFPVLQPNGR